MSETNLDKAIEILGSKIPEAVKHVMAFLAYEGDNPKYHQKAKIAGGMIIGPYVKAEGTKTNRMAVEHAMGRLKELEA